MTVWYQDPISGSNSYTGDSWAVALSGTDGQTYGTTKFTSATGGFTGMEGRYIRIISTLKKIVAVVSDTEVTLDSTYSSGTGRSFWIGGAVQDGSALPYSTGFAPGDEIRVPKTENSDAVSAGTLTWTNKSRSVGFASGRVKEIDQCESGWAGGTGITLAHGTTNCFQGSAACNITVGSTYTGGKMAYKQIGGGSPVDFSAYQGVSFILSMRGSTAVDAADGMRLCLCSDTTGDVIIDDLTMPWLASMQSGSQPMVIYAPGSLGSSIQSVAIYCTNDPGTPTFDIDNIMAVKPIGSSDHLCHRCILSQDDELHSSNTWWGINAFESVTEIKLPWKAYGVTDGAVSSYRRELVPVRAVNWYPGYSGGDGTHCGTRESPITVSGGWDPGTNLQTGATCWYCWAGSAMAMYASAPWVKWKELTIGLKPGGNGLTGAVADGQMFENVNFLGFIFGTTSSTAISDPFSGSTTEGRSTVGWSFKRVRFTGLYYYALYFTPNFYQYQQTLRDWRFEDVKIYGCRAAVFQGAVGWRCVDLEVCGCDAYSSAPFGLTFYYTNWDLEFNRLTLKDSGDYGLRANCLLATRISNLVTEGNATAAIWLRAGELTLFNASIGEATEWVAPTGGVRVASIKHDQTVDSHLLSRYEGTITSESLVRHTASGIAWKMSPTVAGQALRTKIAELAVAAGSYTAGIWLRRDSTGISGKFYTPGGQVGGVADEVSDSITANANIWEQQSIAFTATESGTLEFWVEAVGGASFSLYIDDFSVA
ncbi:MAG: hypothetical protein JXA87_02860 [Thermoleophilia bacterium]|nr:hypothetical protein [Thermoleophilia bacterium]